jgi:hypothetical protein
MSVQPSIATDAQHRSDETAQTQALSISNETDHSSSTLSSWCKSNQRPENHGSESTLGESEGERISSTHGEKVTVTPVITGTTTTKQSRTVSLGEDESRPATKKLKISTTFPNDLHTNYGSALWQRNFPLIAPRQSSNANKITLLANPKDELVLSDLHVFVRQQIEVFTATETDISQPAPGRKNRIQLHQVGLRCIHCRNLPARDRVKRAVCYPSSIARVYHSVSDMKFDHFNHCKGRSPEICAIFQSLKEQKHPKKAGKLINHTSSSSTAQYYHDTALEMGMVDGPGGLYMRTNTTNTATTTTSSDSQQVMNLMNLVTPSSAARYFISNKLNQAMNFMELNRHQQEPSHSNPVLHPERPLIVPRQSNTLTLLADPKDKLVLSQLHIFVRQQIEVFTATVSEITQPAPGRKVRVVLGQVGLRCVHCANIPIKDRVKRAVCYPAAISGIYHAVSNMKFDHFNKCRALPAREREMFAALRSSCGRHGPRNNSGSKCVSNSTAQYYHDSAIALGLVDSENGIRFRDVSSAVSQNAPLPTGMIQRPTAQANLTSETNYSTDGISALMIAAQQQQKIKIANS